MREIVRNHAYEEADEEPGYGTKAPDLLRQGGPRAAKEENEEDARGQESEQDRDGGRNQFWRQRGEGGRGDEGETDKHEPRKDAVRADADQEEDEHEESAFQGPMHGLQRDGGGLDDLARDERLQGKADDEAIQGRVNGKEEGDQDRDAEGRGPPIGGAPKEEQGGRASHQQAERHENEGTGRPEGGAEGRLQEERIHQVVDNQVQEHAKKEGKPWPRGPSDPWTEKEQGEA